MSGTQCEMNHIFTCNETCKDNHIIGRGIRESGSTTLHIDFLNLEYLKTE